MTQTLRFCLNTSKSPTYFNLAKQLQKQALITHFVLPIATRQPTESIQYPSFELVGS